MKIEASWRCKARYGSASPCSKSTPPPSAPTLVGVTDCISCAARLIPTLSAFSWNTRVWIGSEFDSARHGASHQKSLIELVVRSL